MLPITITFAAAPPLGVIGAGENPACPMDISPAIEHGIVIIILLY
jgi:hypothetical protein